MGPVFSDRPVKNTCFEAPLAKALYQNLIGFFAAKNYHLKIYGRSRLFVREAIAETLRYAENFQVPYTELGAAGLAKPTEDIFRIFIHRVPAAEVGFLQADFGAAVSRAGGHKI